MPSSADDLLLEEQKAYYRARAAEYDEWWERTGRHDRGPDFRDSWEREKASVYGALRDFDARGHVLELAAGTGNFTRSLAGTADHITAVDASAETLAIAEAKVADVEGGCPVDFVVADLFDWRPGRRYDVVCFSFWLSHVPEERFEAFWSMVDRALVPGGRFFCVDTLWDAGAVTASSQVVARELGGRQYRVVKVLHQPDDLRARLEGLGWTVEARALDDEFFYTTGVRSDPADGDDA